MNTSYIDQLSELFNLVVKVWVMVRLWCVTIEMKWWWGYICVVVSVICYVPTGLSFCTMVGNSYLAQLFVLFNLIPKVISDGEAWPRDD